MDDKYKLKFVSISAIPKNRKRDIRVDYSRNEEGLYRERLLDELSSIDYKFENDFYVVRIFQRIPNTENTFWKPGTFPVPENCEKKELPFYPQFFRKVKEGSKAGLQIVVGVYKIGDESYEENKHPEEFWASVAGVPGTGGEFIKDLITEGHENDVWFDAIQTARETKKVVEKLFPGWSFK